MILDLESIKNNLPKYVNEFDNKKYDDLKTPFNHFRNIIKALYMYDINEWKKYGIRIVYSKDGCFDKKMKKTLLGKGSFGEVYSTKDVSYVNVPKNVKEVAIKFEKIHGYMDADIPQNLIKKIKNLNYANELGFAPKLYDYFVCIDKNQQFMIIKVMEKINGITLFELGKNKKLYQKANIKKRMMQEKMNKYGIIHYDLRDENVMCVLNKNKTDIKKMYFIDFDLSNNIENNTRNRFKNDDDNIYNYLLQRCIDDGLINIEEFEKYVMNYKEKKVKEIETPFYVYKNLNIYIEDIFHYRDVLDICNKFKIEIIKSNKVMDKKIDTLHLNKKLIVKMFHMTEAKRYIELLKKSEKLNILPKYKLSIYFLSKYVCYVILNFGTKPKWKLFNEIKWISEERKKDAIEQIVDKIKYLHKNGIYIKVYTKSNTILLSLDKKQNIKNIYINILDDNTILKKSSDIDAEIYYNYNTVVKKCISNMINDGLIKLPIYNIYGFQ